MTDKELLRQALEKLMAHVEINHICRKGTQPEFEALIVHLIKTASAQPQL